MKVLFVGDIVGQAGRKVLKEHLARLKEEHRIEFTIANAENAAGGFGLTPSIGEEILACGVDVMTSGNHIWDKKEVFDYIDREPRLLRPGNYPPGTPGNFQCVAAAAGGHPVGVMNFQGRVFMPQIDCPFRRALHEAEKLAGQTRVIIIDFHAEATSEKVAFAWHMNGKVSAVLGTHTHIPTADERVLSEGTAYISDVGMTGSYESVIGMKVEASVARFLTGRPARFETAGESPRLSGVVLEIDESTGSAISIQRVWTPA